MIRGGQALAANAVAAAAIAAKFNTKPFGCSDEARVAKRGGNKNINRQLPSAPKFGAAGAQQL